MKFPGLIQNLDKKAKVRSKKLKAHHFFSEMLKPKRKLNLVSINGKPETTVLSLMARS